MATQIEIFAQEARRIYYGGNVPAEAGWTAAEAQLHAKQALSEIGREEYFSANKSDGVHVPGGSWQVTYPVNLVADSTRKCKYFLVPESYLSLPADKAVVSVTFDNDQTPITRMRGITRKRGRGGPAVGAIDDYYYDIEADRILVYSACRDTVPFSTAWVILAVATAATAGQSEGLAVIARTLQIYNQIVPQKKKDNASDNLDTPTNP